MKIYIALMHSYQPVRGSSKVEVSERCEFLNQLKPRHYDTASVILNYTDKKVVKDRSSTYNYDSFYKYVAEKYPARIEELTRLFPGEETNTN